jgi:hypothetical protein
MRINCLGEPYHTLTSPLIVNPAAHLRRFIGGFNAPHHRNASLSSGFYIVRKVLRLIRLTTALAHCSLFWPVCAVTEAAAPNKKGHRTAVSPVHSGGDRRKKRPRSPRFAGCQIR